MKRILVPIDFSDVTPVVIDMACQLAKGLNAEIHLVHVKEPQRDRSVGRSRVRFAWNA